MFMQLKALLLSAVIVALPMTSDAFAKATGEFRRIKLKCAAEVGALTPNGKSWNVKGRYQLRNFYACVEREGGGKMAL
jgi:hypothetical protein